MVLEELQFDNFALGIKNLIIEYGFGFDLDESIECKTKLKGYLNGDSQDEESSTIEHSTDITAL